MNQQDQHLIARHLAESRLDMAAIEEAMEPLFRALRECDRDFDEERFRNEVYKLRDRVVVGRVSRKIAYHIASGDPDMGTA